ncbi:M20 family peptidase [Ramlibacter henchirensis]|uniref:M20 family peptidase n=1 Tax=Ramlibacter henchirensis TaxID=204072 RepID=A0A4Z0BRP0_9BURK|nr:M20 family peptidase [Ramlibacter henchirensis]TFZ00918.1 M20 family peptidase [Ramlibacter henchirensis]
MIKRIVLVVLGLVLLLAAVVAVNTLRQGSRQIDVAAARPLAVDEKAVADKLSGAVRFRTIASREDADASGAEFRKLHAFLRERFPLVHERLQLETVGGYSLLYTWRGSDPKARPILLMAHQDVVPVSPGTEDKWEAPPFAGAVQGGYVWGRGAWDDKSRVIAQLEAVEMLLAANFQPRQTVYLAFGHDEEVNGLRGALEIVKLFQQRQVRFEFVLDEGSVLTEGVIPNLAKPVALIGLAEKGYLSVLLKASGAPGHASMPPAAGTSAIGQIASALHRLDVEQRPASLRGVGREMFETLAPEFGGFQRVALSNLWLFEPVVRPQLEKANSTNALLRTTTALTVVNAGNKDNVLPGTAEAVVNFRLLPGDTVQGMLEHVRSKAGPGVQVSMVPGAVDPSPISRTDTPAYQVLQRTLRSQFPGVVVSPALVLTGTDSHHFQPVAEQIYRFAPVRVKPQDIPRLHGINERISVANLAELVRFYHLLLSNLNSPAV